MLAAAGNAQSPTVEKHMEEMIDRDDTAGHRCHSHRNNLWLFLGYCEFGCQ